MVYFLYLNFLQLLYIPIILSVIFFGTLINLFEQQLPSVIIQIVRYGKFDDRQIKSPLVVQVPKSWFRHFYIYASILCSTALYLCVNNYIYENGPPRWVSTGLDYTTGSLRRPTVNSTRIFLTITLLTLQCLRRFYETNFISVFGKDAKMNLGHYGLGFLHYTGAVLAILGGAPNFSIVYPAKSILQWADLNMVDLVATYIFLWAWWHQYKAMVILANLRKDSKGNVVTNSYKLPRGDWFEDVSSPHNFAEILMYSSLTLILWPNLTWWFVYAWVIVNQTEVALLSHWWYKEKFVDYPRKRKIIFPCVY